MSGVQSLWAPVMVYGFGVDFVVQFRVQPVSYLFGIKYTLALGTRVCKGSNLSHVVSDSFALKIVKNAFRLPDLQAPNQCTRSSELEILHARPMTSFLEPGCHKPVNPKL